MSGVHDDLATLREARDWIADDDPGEADTGGFHASLVTRVDDALGRVEAELSRLREERDMARAGRDQWERDAKGRGVVQYELLARAQAAEAELATATTTAELAIRQLEAAEARCAAMEECDCIPFSFSSKACPKCGRRGVVSDKTVSRFLIERNEFEARCARLQQALAFYANPSTYVEGSVPHPREFATFVTPIHEDGGQIAREALAGLDTPAGSQPVSYDELRGYVHGGATRSKSPAPGQADSQPEDGT